MDRWQWGRWGSVGDYEAVTATAEEGGGGGAEIGVLLLPGVGWVLSSICDEKAGHSEAVLLAVRLQNPRRISPLSSRI